MEMKINKTVNVEIDESLGYTMVFIKFDGLTNGMVKDIKAGFQDAFIDDDRRGIFNNARHLKAAVDEYRLLNSWLDRRYLCYPAYSDEAPEYRYCGPKYNHTLYHIVEEADRPNQHIGAEFQYVCSALSQQIVDLLKETVVIAEASMAAELQEMPGQSTAKEPFTKKLKRTVDELSRKDIVWEDDNVYYQTTHSGIQGVPEMVSLWKKNCDLSDAVIGDIVALPLISGKVLLTLPRKMKAAQSEYWILLTDIVGRDNVKNAAAALNTLYNALGKPKEKSGQSISSDSPAFREGLKEVVEKLNRKDVIYEQASAYLQMKQPIPSPLNTASIANLLAFVAGWNDSQIWHRFTAPLEEGKILLTLPTEMNGAENAYRTLLRTIVCESIVREVKVCQEALYDIIDEQTAPKAKKIRRPQYFQASKKFDAHLMENMRDLWWYNNTYGIGWPFIENLIVKPLREGRINLLADLPEVVAELGPKYCQLLKHRMDSSEWTKFIVRWNKTHPDTKV